MKKYQIPIKGMHCRSCEIIVEKELLKVSGVMDAKASFLEKKAWVYFEGKISEEEVHLAVKRAGYQVGKDEKKPWISRSVKDYEELGTAFLLLVILYLVIKNTGLLNLSSSFGSPSSLTVVVMIGLTAGLSTCMAMVGGIILGVSARHAEKHPTASPLQKFRPHIFFNLGRLISYTFLGGIIASIGSAFQLSGSVLGYLTIVVGIVMFWLGLQLIEIFPRLSSGHLTLPSSVSKFLGLNKHQGKEYSHKNAFILGFFTFFLPCGFTQAMQLYAMSTGRFASGALIMGAFAIGTMPGLLSVGGLSSIVKGSVAKKFFKFVGLAVILLALFNISNGLNLTGYSIKRFLPSKTIIDSADPNVEIKDGLQIVRMKADTSGYSPNTFTIKEKMPVKWIITASEQTSCANFLVSQKLGIKKGLKKGENIIEFTPEETGEISFMCSMGMFTGSFNVVKNNNSSQSKPKDKIGPELPSTSEVKEEIPSVDTQILKTTYTPITDYSNYSSDLNPSQFTIQAGKPARLEVEATADGVGCMSTITVPGLTDEIEALKKGKVVLNLDPKKKGEYQITCAMGAPRGTITVTD